MHTLSFHCARKTQKYYCPELLSLGILVQGLFYGFLEKYSPLVCKRIPPKDALDGIENCAKYAYEEFAQFTVHNNFIPGHESLSSESSSRIPCFSGSKVLNQIFIRRQRVFKHSTVPDHILECEFIYRVIFLNAYSKESSHTRVRTYQIRISPR